MANDKDITEQLIEEEKEIKKQIEKKEKELEKVTKTTTPKKSEKTETIASETPQDRFRRILKDQGLSIGVENLTSVFFQGDTDSPAWLDYVLKLSHIPNKTRELVLTAYYGRTIEDLGIPADALSSSFTARQLEKQKDKEKAKKEEDELFDIAKLSEDELKERIKMEKSLLSLAQMKSMREEIENRINKDNRAGQQQNIAMKQVSRPLIKDGQVIKDAGGNIVYETSLEPVAAGGSSNDILTTIAALKALSGDDKKGGNVPTELTELLRTMSQKIESIEKTRELDAKDNEIRRLNEKVDTQHNEHKRELEQKEKEAERRLEELNKERIRDMDMIEKRFTEALQHRKELDDIVGSITSSHKKEIDDIKKKLEHAQTSIERTVVAKSTDTVDKLSGKLADTVDNVVKPLVGVMRDHYTTVIDQQRKTMGLPNMRDSIPEVDEDELRKFAGSG